MRKFAVWGLLLALLAVAGCGNEEITEVPKQAITVVDGDTIRVRLKGKEETVRLLLVDTPETNHPEIGKQPLGEEAKEFTQKLIHEAKKIELEKEETKRDKYGRFLAYVVVDGKLLQEELVKSGFARIAYVEDADAKYLDKMKEAEQKAQQKKVGIWQWDDYSKRDGFKTESLKKERNIFVASKNSDVYHPIGCHVANDIKPENLIYYYSEQEAIKDNRHRSQVKECWEAYQ
ncbi:thermonuclease family protein [Thermoactinomyces mirandus]|uniref:Thermonuclease family protein n=1 Tax=Thermoactinomyces mirandus TaxID=2756294 RepID=A0A7W1XST1_9BACL|nr:thermonuclease family protein [Thermoactinomyces mirandus]MBA4602492.1 thermonuclease family protein [Thermoactinomyces mirandus]